MKTPKSRTALTGSMAEDLSGKPATAVATSSDDNTDSSMNSVKDTPGGTGLYVGGDDPEMEDRVKIEI